ncbi:MAG: flagellar basal-body rod protein FlgF [Vallitaleaceae bacterium]|nr:flagellar basal-body rod protein FlgF [Vallitaleaceae bacterium]
MTRGLYTAYTGMLAQQKKMDTISNNLANVNTTGYKKDGVVFESFKEVYMVKINDPEQPGVQKIGKGSLGVKTGEIYTDFSLGPVQETDNPLNMALDTAGMFAVGSYDKEGNLIEKYTRDGSFGLNAQGQIVTNEGLFLLGENGPITVSNNHIRISDKGIIFDGSTRVDQIKVVNFEDLSTLKKITGDLYESSQQSQTKPYEGLIAQGFIEGSNVSSIDEMINMINVMRTYETNQKVITTYDETMSKAVNEVGRL